MSSLRNRSPKNSYKELLTLSNDQGLVDALSIVGDGNGGVSPLSLSTNKIALNGILWPAAAPTANQYLRVNSANTQLEWVAGVTQIPYDIAGSINGKPAAAAVVLSFVAVRNFTIPANMTGSLAKVTTVGTSAGVYSIKKDGVEFGKITFAAGGTNGVFTASTATAIVPGNVITIVAPALADATFANAVFTIMASTT